MMERKPVRLSGTSYAVLSLLEHLGEATPYDLKQAIEQTVSNFWPVPHTTFYAEPARLAEAGFLAERQEQHGRRRKLYRLTDPGRDALHAWATTPDAAPPQIYDEAVLKIFAGADPLPLLHERRRWHVAKIAELQGYLDEQPWEDAQREASERTLRVGLDYHQRHLAAVEGFTEQMLAQEREQEA
jgi:DNA-binding PadR family transcriptional regulator